MTRNKLALAVVVLSMLALPAYAQALDTSRIETFLTSVVEALTGTPARLLMTIILIGALIGGAMTIIDWSKVFWIIIIIVLIAGIPTFVQAMWT